MTMTRLGLLGLENIMQHNQECRSTRTQQQWKKDFEDNEVVVKRKRLRVGAKVSTEHGTGIITGRDHPYRFVVKVTDPNAQSKDMVNRFKDAQLCYFPKEIEICN